MQQQPDTTWQMSSSDICEVILHEYRLDTQKDSTSERVINIENIQKTFVKDKLKVFCKSNEASSETKEKMKVIWPVQSVITSVAARNLLCLACVQQDRKNWINANILPIKLVKAPVHDKIAQLNESIKRIKDTPENLKSLKLWYEGPNTRKGHEIVSTRAQALH